PLPPRPHAQEQLPLPRPARRQRSRNAHPQRRRTMGHPSDARFDCTLTSPVLLGMEKEVDDCIFEAWERVGPTLENDPEEVLRRVKRMWGRALSRPPRAWCLAVRACDRRIDEALGFGYATRDGPGAHDVLLDAKLVRALCAPVML